MPCNDSVSYDMGTGNFFTVFAHHPFIILCHHLKVEAHLNKPLFKVQHLLSKLCLAALQASGDDFVSLLAELCSECAEQHSLLW